MTWPFPTVANPRKPVPSQLAKPRRPRKTGQTAPQRKPRAHYPSDAAEALL